jgi:hypothetical protein
MLIVPQGTGDIALDWKKEGSCGNLCKTWIFLMLNAQWKTMVEKYQFTNLKGCFSSLSSSPSFFNISLISFMYFVA